MVEDKYKPGQVITQKPESGWIFKKTPKGEYEIVRKVGKPAEERRMMAEAKLRAAKEVAAYREQQEKIKAGELMPVKTPEGVFAVPREMVEKVGGRFVIVSEAFRAKLKGEEPKGKEYSLLLKPEFERPPPVIQPPVKIPTEISAFPGKRTMTGEELRAAERILKEEPTIFHTLEKGVHEWITPAERWVVETIAGKPEVVRRLHFAPGVAESKITYEYKPFKETPLRRFGIYTKAAIAGVITAPFAITKFAASVPRIGFEAVSEPWEVPKKLKRFTEEVVAATKHPYSAGIIGGQLAGTVVISYAVSKGISKITKPKLVKTVRIYKGMERIRIGRITTEGMLRLKETIRPIWGKIAKVKAKPYVLKEFFRAETETILTKAGELTSEVRSFLEGKLKMRIRAIVEAPKGWWKGQQEIVGKQVPFKGGAEYKLFIPKRLPKKPYLFFKTEYGQLKLTTAWKLAESKAQLYAPYEIVGKRVLPKISKIKKIPKRPLQPELDSTVGAESLAPLKEIVEIEGGIPIKYEIYTVPLISWAKPGLVVAPPFAPFMIEETELPGVGEVEKIIPEKEVKLIEAVLPKEKIKPEFKVIEVERLQVKEAEKEAIALRKKPTTKLGLEERLVPKLALGEVVGMREAVKPRQKMKLIPKLATLQKLGTGEIRELRLKIPSISIPWPIRKPKYGIERRPRIPRARKRIRPTKKPKLDVKVMADWLAITRKEMEKMGKAYHPKPTRKVKREFARRLLWKGAAMRFPVAKEKKKKFKLL